MNAVPNAFVALCEHGNLLQQQGHFEAAVASYSQALQDRPQSAAALTNRSNALRALGRLPEALADLDAALAIRPLFPEGLNNRGNVLRDLGMLPAALESFERALRLRPDFPMALCNRGKTLLDLARCQEALESFAMALQLDPGDGEALFGHASARLRLGQDLALAAEEFDRSSGHGIPPTEALVGQAASWAGLECHTEAAACIEELLRLDPQWEYAQGALLHSRLKTCDWHDLSELVEAVRAGVAQGQRASHPHSLLAATDSPELQLACARAVSEHKLPPRPQSAAPASAAARNGERLRVAYVSADFCDHPVPQLLIGTLERHDRARFEIIGVRLRPGRGHPFEQRIREAFDDWIDATALTAQATASRLRDAGVDIAVDLMGYTEGMRLETFVHRAAPVQVSYLGYAGSTGSACMDYILADAVVIPPGEESGYSEQVVRLPHCYLPNDDRRPIALPPARARVGLPDRAFVFCAFTSAHKINPPVFEVWMRLLWQVPGSVLWLRDAGSVARDNLVREARMRGIDPARLVFAPPVPDTSQHLARLSLADLYLDTFPYNAHSTACDALWAGVPVLTCAGRGFASRVAASALCAAGLPELITLSLPDYEAAALRIAREPQQLDALRRRLGRERGRLPLFDTARYTCALEAAYALMQQRALAGLAPQGFEVT